MQAQFSSNTFAVPGTDKTIFYLTAGPTDGPLIFFLHGWPGIALTWQHQLQSFASLGFRVVAPDMPGYGQTWTSKDSSEFAMELIVPQLLGLLKHTGRKDAIWFGHDWGCGPLWAIASHHPEVCRAVIGMSVPYRTLELGLKYLLPTIDRKLYPEDEFIYGPWDYQIFYEQQPEATDRLFEADVATYVKLLFSRGSEQSGLGLARTSQVTKHGGWFGGPSAVGKVPQLPLERTVLDEPLFNEVVAALTDKGFHGATAWYLNHAANEKYGLEQSVNDGRLDMPVLFIHTEYDSVCQSVHNPLLAKEMRDHTGNLSEIVIKAGHWGMLECPHETNSGIAEWILKEVKDSWPGPVLKTKL